MIVSPVGALALLATGLIVDRCPLNRADIIHRLVECRTGQALSELQIPRNTGVRVIGIARAEEKILVPQAAEVLRPGDRLLGLGTLDQLRQFRRWLETSPVNPSPLDDATVAPPFTRTSKLRSCSVAKVALQRAGNPSG